MRYVNIPVTELKASIICFGTQSMGAEISKSDSFTLLDTFVDQGGNFLDTAHIYSDWIPGEKGRSERIIGEWIKERGIRDKVIIGTKGAHPNFEIMNVPRLSNNEITSDLDESLKYLKTDYVDLYWLHRDDPKRSVEEILENMNCKVKDGKVRYFGCSNWKPARIKEAAEYAARKGISGFVANQMMWSLAVPNKDAIADKTIVSMDEEGIRLHKELGLTAVPYSSQAQGFFSKMKLKGTDGLDQRLKDIYHNTHNLKVFERAQKLAEQLSMSITEISLSYIISQPEFTSIPVIGCKNIEQLSGSLKASNRMLSPYHICYLEDIQK